MRTLTMVMYPYGLVIIGGWGVGEGGGGGRKEGGIVCRLC